MTPVHFSQKFHCALTIVSIQNTDSRIRFHDLSALPLSKHALNGERAKIKLIFEISVDYAVLILKALCRHRVQEPFPARIEHISQLKVSVCYQSQLNIGLFIIYCFWPERWKETSSSDISDKDASTKGIAWSSRRGISSSFDVCTLHLSRTMRWCRYCERTTDGILNIGERKMHIKYTRWKFW